jgi:predicted nuclease with TOPRIM domain
MGTWLVVGIFFGLFSPLQNHVEHVRETVRCISLTKWGAPVRLLQKIEQKKKQIDDLVAENVRLKTRITRLELESTEMEKRVKMIEKKLSGL